MINSRIVAFDILYKIFNDSAYSNIAIDRALLDVDGRDKGFITRMVYGVVERKLTLDYFIDEHLSQRTKPKVKLLLYIGAYQIIFMDNIPSQVAVNETVKIADDLGLGYYKKLINAVLRKIVSSDIDIDKLDNFDIKYSCPQPLINKWKKMYGEDNTLAILNSINNKPPVFAIPNKLYVDVQELQYELLDEGIESEIYEDVLKISSKFDLNSSRSFKNGLFYIEDYSSYLCAKALNVGDDDVVLDVCSAPGGKTFTLAQDLGADGKIYAFDLHKHRVELVKEGAKRLGFENIICVENDATIYSEEVPKANKILCDVVCSGFGIIRRKPEIRYKDLDSIKELPNIQYDILDTSSRYLINGGEIIYSTCTLNKQENERVVERFLQNNGNFKLLEMKTIFPSNDAGDGFFWAKMVKNSD